MAQHFKLIFSESENPFKYRSIKYFQKILHSPQLEQDVRDFKIKESRVRRHWQYEAMINRDISRTRFLADETGMHTEIKRVIEFYCSQINVAYCQGMLEVVLPFLYLRNCDENPELELAQVYGYFKRFVRIYITNILHPKFNGRTNVLPYIKCTLYYMDILFAYVDKELHHHISKKKVQIETYAAGWVTTLFSRTVDFTMLYELWEIFLFERDQFFIFYFAIAICKFNRDKILKLKSFERIISLMQKLTIANLQELAEIYQIAIEVRRQTPVSFQQSA